MINYIPVFALLFIVIIGISVIIVISKRIESEVERINSKENILDNAIFTTEAAVKWFLRDRNMEVVRSYGRYNVQSICLNCCRQRPECCIDCAARRTHGIAINSEDVQHLVSKLESCTTRVVRTICDNVDVLAQELKPKSGKEKR